MGAFFVSNNLKFIPMLLFQKHLLVSITTRVYNSFCIKPVLMCILKQRLYCMYKF